MRTIVGVLATLCIGCSNAPSPTQPTVPRGGGAGPDPGVHYAVFGVVVDPIRRPISEVRVEVTDGPRAGASALTDAEGRYELPGTFAGLINVRASKDGYVTAVRPEGPVSSVGERRFVLFTLELSAPSVNLTGTYTMTVTADAACGLAADLRTRTYAASITPNWGLPSPNYYEAVLSGARFLALPQSFRPHANRMDITVAGTMASFYLGDIYEMGDAIIEEVGPSAYLVIWGVEIFPVDNFPTGGALGYGGIEYCESPTPLTSGFVYRCPSAPVKCKLQHLQLVRQ